VLAKDIIPFFWPFSLSARPKCHLFAPVMLKQVRR
jgi:hypothetical protein